MTFYQNFESKKQIENTKIEMCVLDVEHTICVKRIGKSRKKKLKKNIKDTF